MKEEPALGYCTSCHVAIEYRIGKLGKTRGKILRCVPGSWEYHRCLKEADTLAPRIRFNCKDRDIPGHHPRERI